MDNVNFEDKTNWVQDETVYPADANRWEKGIKDCADLVNNHNEKIPLMDAETAKKVNKSGDTMTGALKVPTPSESENSTVVPTTAWVKKFLNDKLGKVYLSQSSLASDNNGALPLFTGETIASANTIYPDFYNWVSSHTELQCLYEEYETALSTYGECPKYVLGGTTTKVTQINFSRLGYPIYTKNPTFTTDDDGNPYAKEQAYSDTNLTNQLANVEVVWQVQSGTTYTVYIIPNSTTGFAQTEITTDNNYENDSISYNYYSFTIYDGSIRLPKLSNYIKAANTSEGITQAGAGLPNITGTTSDSGDGNNNQARVTGAFFVKATSIKSNKDDQWRGLEIGFDASRSSAVYGASDTVTPAHTTLYPWVVAYTAAIPASTAQAAEFQQGLSGKADTSLGNLSATGKSIASGLGMPSNRHIDLTLGASGSTYTAPANGWVFFSKRSTAAGQWIQIVARQSYSYHQILAVTVNPINFLYPVMKNETFDINYTAAGTTEKFRFIYAEGDK